MRIAYCAYNLFSLTQTVLEIDLDKKEIVKTYTLNNENFDKEICKLDIDKIYLKGSKTYLNGIRENILSTNALLYNKNRKIEVEVNKDEIFD